MSFEILVVFGLILIGLTLFVWERLSFDLTALVLLGGLLLTGVVTPEEGFAGFSNPAVVTIGAMFVLSQGLRRTGVLDLAGQRISSWGRGRFWPTLLLMMGTLAGISLFINNTAAIVIFIPIALGVAAELKVSPSKLLIPLSFASMLGGVCTLIGTSTNLLVSSIAADQGLQPFSMFELAPVGLVFLAVGFGYLVLAAVPMLPERRPSEDLTRSYGMRGYITDVEVQEGCDLVGRTAKDSALEEGLDIDVLEILRPGDERSGLPVSTSGSQSEAQGVDVAIQAGDRLRVRGSADQIDRLLRRPGLLIQPSVSWVDADLEAGHSVLVEAVVAPSSAAVQQPVRELRFGERFGAIVLALRRHGELEHRDLGKTQLAGGDSVLLLMDPDRIQEVERDRAFVLVSPVGRRQRWDRMPWAVTILTGVVIAAATGVMPIVVSSVVGAVLLVVTGCLTTEEAYEAVSWKVIFLLAGILPLGTAMEKTGTAQMLADTLLGALGDLGPHAVLAGFLFLTMALTAVVTNNATAVLLAPVAISTAATLEVDPRPLLMGVTYAASLSFVTPMGYQTNTLVYGPGGYAFTDYLKIGTPLSLILLILGTLLIPVVFPF